MKVKCGPAGHGLAAEGCAGVRVGDSGDAGVDVVCTRESVPGWPGGLLLLFRSPPVFKWGRAGFLGPKMVKGGEHVLFNGAPNK